MPFIMGLDPSLAKAGYVIIDTDDFMKDGVFTVVEKGMFKTSSSSGVLVQRLTQQGESVRSLIKKYNITFVAKEAPAFEGFNTEILFSLNQFIHRVFIEESIFVVEFPPQQLKKLVFPNKKVHDIHKVQMTEFAKTKLNMLGGKLSEDEADAFWAGYFGVLFYKWAIEKSIEEEDLDPYVLETFAGKYTFKKGAKKGITEYTGIIYRENESFFNYKKIKELAASLPTEKPESTLKSSKNKKKKNTKVSKENLETIETILD